MHSESLSFNVKNLSSTLSKQLSLPVSETNGDNDPVIPSATPETSHTIHPFDLSRVLTPPIVSKPSSEQSIFLSDNHLINTSSLLSDTLATIDLRTFNPAQQTSLQQTEKITSSSKKTRKIVLPQTFSSSPSPLETIKEGLTF
ncbi:hypothetical protein GEMRC1_004159 [Eukaryota sp. GEM-RC1]